MTTAPRPATTDQPSIRDLSYSAGAEFAAHCRAGYVDGHERTLAERLLAVAMPAYGLTPDAVLDELVYDHLEGVIAVDCLLDECDEASYATTRAMAELLCAEIRRQGGQETAVRELLLDAIVADARLAQVLATAPEGATA